MKPLQPIKGKPALYVTLLAATVLAMFGMKFCSSPTSSDIDAKSQGDTLDIAIEISPTSLSTSNDTLSGYYYELMQLISRHENIPVKYIPFAQIDSALSRLERGRYDMVIAHLPVTTELKERFLFTDPIELDKEVLVQLRDTTNGKPGTLTHNDLRGDTVWLPAGSPFKDRIINLSHEIGDTIYIMEDPDYASEQLIMMVAIGEIPCAVVNENIAKKMKKRYPLLDISVDISFSQFQSWAINKSDTTLRDSMNTWLNRHAAHTSTLRNKHFPQ